MSEKERCIRLAPRASKNGTLARLDAAERQARGTGRQPAFGKESRKSACGSAKKRRTLVRACEARVRPLGIPAPPKQPMGSTIRNERY